MAAVFYLAVFIFGTLVGSFLNCVIYRLEKKRSFLSGRSFCPHCRRILRWYDLIPILSFIFLGGRCRYCQKKISFQYPIVEIATGLIFLLISNFQFPISNEFSIFNFQTFINFGYLLTISCFLIVIFVYDLKHYIIPDKIVYPAIAIVFLYNVSSFKFQVSSGFTSSLIAAFSVGIFFFLIWLTSQGRWMGLGDAKLGFLLGLFLGWSGILVALFSAFLIGAIIGIGLIVFDKKTLQSQVPFGPFLVLGTFIALFLGERLINLYLGFV